MTPWPRAARRSETAWSSRSAPPRRECRRALHGQSAAGLRNAVALVRRPSPQAGGTFPGPARMPTVSPSAWQQESRKMSGRLFLTIGRIACPPPITHRRAEDIPGMPPRQRNRVEPRGGAPVVKVSQQGVPEAMRLHMGDDQPFVHGSVPRGADAGSARAPSTLPGLVHRENVPAIGHVGVGGQRTRCSGSQGEGSLRRYGDNWPSRSSVRASR